MTGSGQRPRRPLQSSTAAKAPARGLRSAKLELPRDCAVIGIGDGSKARATVRTAALVTAASQRDVRHITFVLDHLVYGSVDPEHRFAEVVDVAPATIRDAGGDGDERPL